jgi:hypothetical protein
MSKLLELIDTVRSIPSKERHADNVGALSKLCEAVERGTAELANCHATARNAAAVMARDEFSGVGTATAKVARSARLLRRDLEVKPAESWSKRGDDLMMTITEQLAGAKKLLRDRWRAFVDATKRDYGALARAGREAKLPGAVGLENTLQKFEAAASNAPSTAAAAERVKQDLELIRKAIRELGLTGEVGSFMVAAAEAGANPQDLYKPEIRDFLDARPDIWRLLSVQLRGGAAR